MTLAARLQTSRRSTTIAMDVPITHPRGRSVAVAVQSDIYPGAGSYDREGEQWSVPVNVIVTKVTKVGGQLISVGAGLRYWADSPESGPEGLGLRLVFTLLFPK